mmetsp:Transcript_24609/g.30103  ORF Transcript_24609/g.30103 Transcript_24609/m.30103 type:complete len:211 (-) Transcript_24609:99-731(-)
MVKCFSLRSKTKHLVATIHYIYIYVYITRTLTSFVNAMSKGYQCPRWIKRHRKLFFYISFGCAILTYLFVLNKLIANVEQNDFQLYAYKFNSLKRLLYSAEEENTNERQRVPLVHKAERNMLFIHVGKAGGSTLQAFIKREKFLGVSTGAELALQVNGSVHCDQPQHVDQYTSFLVTVRNPIDRFVSWFGYANPKNKKYVAKYVILKHNL